MKLPSRRLGRPNQKMQPTYHLSISRVVCGFMVFCATAIGMHAQNLSPMAPTSQPGPSSPAASAAATAVPNTPLHAEVVYTSGQLQVRADNSSLNQILRSICHVTGLKITGGVEEQRVFGNYGPAPLSTILSMLLDGTGANVLLVGGNGGSTAELVLTPRAGGAEPPGPNSPVYAMYDDRNDRSNPVPPPGARVAGSPAQKGTSATATPSTVVPSASTTATPSARAPGQPLTPEMVAQELLQMQAQQDEKKKQLDQTLQQQQVDQDRKLKSAQPQNQPVQPPNESPTPQ